MKININNVERDMTPAEEAEHIALSTQANEDNTNTKANEEAKETLKASAKAKLVAGEALTEEEADTIVL